jgi:hypothetical protein
MVGVVVIAWAAQRYDRTMCFTLGRLEFFKFNKSLKPYDILKKDLFQH